MDIPLYRDEGLAIYEQIHYGRGEHRQEVAQILSWYQRPRSRVLDLGCSGGLHALELAGLGHHVTGIDIEPSAITLARQRARALHLPARFYVADLVHDALTPLGNFDLVYSIGNVLSHLPKTSLTAVMRKIRGSCAENAVFLFDLLMIGPQVPEEIREPESGIVWQRSVDPASGRIDLHGVFAQCPMSPHFVVWGYTLAEVAQCLNQAGFSSTEYSETLDFPSGSAVSQQASCLRFRAHVSRRTP